MSSRLRGRDDRNGVANSVFPQYDSEVDSETDSNGASPKAHPLNEAAFGGGSCLSQNLMTQGGSAAMNTSENKCEDSPQVAGDGSLSDWR